MHLKTKLFISASRVQNQIDAPKWEDYITDDEVAVKNVIHELYPESEASSCLFHVNKNIVKALTSEHLSHYIRRCKSDVQLWTYSKFREIMCIPFLPVGKMKPQFLVLKNNIVESLTRHLDPMELDKIKTVLRYIENKIYSVTQRTKSVCKFDKSVRTTNNAEGSHSGFNKSALITKNSSLNSMIQGKTSILYL